MGKDLVASPQIKIDADWVMEPANNPAVVPGSKWNAFPRRIAVASPTSTTTNEIQR